MDKQEKVVCAAVQITYKDGIGDYAIDVICDATYKLIRQGQSYKRQHFVHASTAKDTDGFRTNYGRFVDAKEAMEIAIKAGQYLEKSDETLTCEVTLGAVLRLPKSNRCRRKENVKGWIEALRYSRKQDDLRELKPEDLY